MESTLPTIVTCGCGHELRAEEPGTLLEEADRHVREAHPHLVGTLSPLELASPARHDDADDAEAA